MPKTLIEQIIEKTVNLQTPAFVAEFPTLNALLQENPGSLPYTGGFGHHYRDMETYFIIDRQIGVIYDIKTTLLFSHAMGLKDHRDPEIRYRVGICLALVAVYDDVATRQLQAYVELCQLGLNITLSMDFYQHFFCSRIIPAKKRLKDATDELSTIILQLERSNYTFFVLEIFFTKLCRVCDSLSELNTFLNAFEKEATFSEEVVQVKKEIDQLAAEYNDKMLPVLQVLYKELNKIKCEIPSLEETLVQPVITFEEAAEKIRIIFFGEKLVKILTKAIAHEKILSQTKERFPIDEDFREKLETLKWEFCFEAIEDEERKKNIRNANIVTYQSIPYSEPVELEKRVDILEIFMQYKRYGNLKELEVSDRSGCFFTDAEQKFLDLRKILSANIRLQLVEEIRRIERFLKKLEKLLPKKTYALPDTPDSMRHNQELLERVLKKQEALLFYLGKPEIGPQLAKVGRQLLTRINNIAEDLESQSPASEDELNKTHSLSR